jgi:malate dehydrogenase (oxaloacetate-decarboxylating)(NADP+)
VQFPDATIGGKAFYPGQASNFYIYSEIGLATYGA